MLHMKGATSTSRKDSYLPLNMIFFLARDWAATKQLRKNKKSSSWFHPNQNFEYFTPVKSQRNGFAGVKKGCLPTIFLPSGDFPSNHCGRQIKLVKIISTQPTQTPSSPWWFHLFNHGNLFVGETHPFFSARFGCRPHADAIFRTHGSSWVAHHGSWMLVSGLKQSC